MRKFDISKFDNKEDLNIFLESDRFDYRDDILVLDDIEIGISGKFKEFKQVAPSINNSLNKNKSNERAL